MGGRQQRMTAYVTNTRKHCPLVSAKSITVPALLTVDSWPVLISPQIVFFFHPPLSLYFLFSCDEPILLDDSWSRSARVTVAAQGLLFEWIHAKAVTQLPTSSSLSFRHTRGRATLVCVCAVPWSLSQQGCAIFVALWMRFPKTLLSGWTGYDQVLYFHFTVRFVQKNHVRFKVEIVSMSSWHQFFVRLQIQNTGHYWK